MSSTPTNSDLMREIKSINRVTDDHETRIKAVEHYKTTQEAVAEYVAQYGTAAQREGASIPTLDAKSLGAIILKLLAFFTGVIGLLYLIVQNLS